MGHALLFILVLAMSGISARAIWRNVSRGQCGLGFAMRAAFLCTVLAPPTVLYALLPWMNLEAPGINGFVSSTLGSEIHFHVRLQMLTVLSWVGLEASYASFMRRNAWELSAAGPSNPHAARAEKTVLVLGWLLAIAAVAVLANHYQTFRIGQLAGKIAVGMRMQWNSPDRADLPAFAFSILGALQCHAALGFFAGPPPRRTRIVTAICIALTSLPISGSRRAFIVPIVVSLLTSLSLRWMRSAASLLIVSGLALAVLIPFGRSAFRAMANQSDLGQGVTIGSEINSDELIDQCGYIAIELSMSQIESLSTIRRYDGPPLLGCGHWLALARVVVKESLFGIRLPRVTRQMTEMHTGDPDANDVPAGFVGAAWSDAGWLGFLVLPVLLGGVAALFDRWAITRRWTDGGRYCCIAAGYLLFFQTMNTGTIDYALSPQSLLVIALSAWAMSHMPKKLDGLEFNSRRGTAS